MSTQDCKLPVDKGDLKSTADMNNSEATELPLRLRDNTTASTETGDSAQTTQQPEAEDGDESGVDQEIQEDHDYGKVTNVPPAATKKKKKSKKRKPNSKRGLVRLRPITKQYEEQLC